MTMGLIQRYRAWRDRRKVAETVQPTQRKAMSPSHHQILAKSGMSAFSLTYDDLSEVFRMVGPTTPLYSWMTFADQELDRLLMASSWSWASINGNAKAMGQLSPIVQYRSAGKWAKAPDKHPLWTFVGDPLGTDDRLPYWSWQHLFYVLALHYYSAGNAWLVPVEAAGELSVVPLLRPHTMTADEDPRYGAPTLYRYPSYNQSPEKTYTPGQIVNIQAPSATSLWKGASPLRAALRSTEIDYIASERQRHNLRNRIAPGPVVAFDYMGPTDEQREQIKAELIADYRDPENEGDPLVLGGAAKIYPGPTSEELQVFETKNSARQEIIATIGTQPSILGQLDGATYSNTKEATVLWFNGSIAPILSVIYGQLNAQLVQRHYGKDVRIWYSLAGSQIGTQLMLAQLDVAEKLSALGYTTNDINEQLELGMPQRDYLDKSADTAARAGRGAVEDDPETAEEEPPEDPEQPDEEPTDEDQPD